MQKQFKYIYNNEEVSREEFEKLAGDSFKWFDGDSIVSVPFYSFFTGDFKSRRQINDHLDSVLNIYQNKVTEDIINKPKCSPQCYCDGSCKKDLEVILPMFRDKVKVAVEKNTNSTRHKSQAGETHTENLIFVKEGTGFDYLKRLHKDDVITSNNRGEKETVEYLQGLKYNNLKPSLDIVINRQFPKALQLIALATEYGHKKYIENDVNYLNYKSVKGGSQTYFDASARHSTDRNGLDESGLPHIIHAVWSSLAGLELWAEENKINVKKFTENYMKNLHNSK
jgi:hypothetical protein